MILTSCIKFHKNILHSKVYPNFKSGRLEPLDSIFLVKSKQCYNLSRRLKIVSFSCYDGWSFSSNLFFIRSLFINIFS